MQSTMSEPSNGGVVGAACDHVRALRPKRSTLRRLLAPLNSADSERATDLAVGLALAVGAARLMTVDGGAFDSWAAHAREIGQDIAAKDPGARKSLDKVLALVPHDRRDRWLAELNDCAATGMFALTELYSEFIASRQREATRRAHRQHDKIGGRELRLATQYFTPNDLSYAIVSHTLQGTIGDSSPSHFALLVDPACGTGNLLLVGLHNLTHRWEAAGLAVPDAAVVATRCIRGYDLDQTVARICNLALEVEARILGGMGIETGHEITWGNSRDSIGFLNADLPLISEIKAAEGRVALVTNPPFLGRRLMSAELKGFLNDKFPLAGNELCAAFVQGSINAIKPGDAAGFVSQTAWMHLTSYESLRRDLLRRAGIHWFCDIGPGAFDRLSGEKARVALLTLIKGQTDLQGRVLDLNAAAERDRSELLFDPEGFETLAPEPSAIRSFPGVRFVLGIDERLATAFAELARYGNFATPMQGTSTGDNETFVALWWASESWSEEWVLASKGGAHARWAGHDHHLVRWGVDGDGLTAKGAAIRNATKIRTADIVYSDTGSGGMNARVRREGQVFIAGGPAVSVDTGLVEAHLAFLNSRLASAFVEVLSPKLVTTPGVLAEIPCAAEILDDEVLASLGRQALHAKAQRIRSSMPAPMWTTEPSTDSLLASAQASYVRDIKLEMALLDAERQIDSRVAEYYRIQPSQLHRFTGEQRPPEVDLSNIKELDHRVKGMLGPNRQFQGDRAGRHYSSGGVVDSLARATGATVAGIGEHLLASWDHLHHTRALYIEDALHTRVLRHVWRAGKSLKLSDVESLLSDQSGCLPFDLNGWLRRRFTDRQRAIFPGLTMPPDEAIAPEPPKPILLAYGF